MLLMHSLIKATMCVELAQTLMLYTGTGLYRNTGFAASISESVFPLLSIQFSFWYNFSWKYFKNM